MYIFVYIFIVVGFHVVTYKYIGAFISLGQIVVTSADLTLKMW